MNFGDLLKQAFPKPRIPQKRYLVLVAGIVYAIARLYVESTPTPTDDAILEKAREIAMQIIVAENQDSSSEQTYGETS